MKKEKIKEESTLKKTIKELKKTSRGKAILRLIKWCIFFIILFIFLAIMAVITPKNNNITKPNTDLETKKPEPENPLNDLEEILSIKTLNNTYNSLKEYDYNYEVFINNSKYIFKGTKNKINNTGYKESPEGIIKYVIDESGIYNETTSGKTPITNLYDGLNEEYFNLEWVFNILKMVELKINYDHNCTNYYYVGVLEDVTYEIELEENTKKLLFINIITDNSSYSLNFSNIHS